MRVGIEAINLYGGAAYIDVRTIFEGRGLQMDRFDNLMMKKKAMVLPCEDPVTNAVNAAKPIIDRLTDAEKNRIEMVITCTESGLDFCKSLSTYVHDYLGLSRNCRLFELKQACYGATAALHLAASFVMSQVSPGAKVLVIATDVARTTERMSYAEPSQAEGACAMLISDQPHIFELDFGATGCYSYEVMDACRPVPEMETGSADLTLLSYLDCLENSYKAYTDKVDGVDYRETFDYLLFHTPFAGMVKGAHRKMMRQLYHLKPDVIEADFARRVAPSLSYCVEVGNVYSATLYFALCGLIDHAEMDDVKRLGMFSYGSGCSSEFFSGTVAPSAKARLRQMHIREKLDSRYQLTMEQYDQLLDLNKDWGFGVCNKPVELTGCARDIYQSALAGKGLLALKAIKGNYHREYDWT